MGSYFLVSGVVAVIATAIIVYPSEYKCRSYQMPPSPKLEGPLAVNDVLTNAESILENAVYGPESVELVGDALYTGTQDGLVKQVKGGVVRKVSRLADVAHPCNGSYESEPACGRPLGIRHFDGQRIAIVDAYLGLFYIDFDAGIHGALLKGKDAVVDGKPLQFMNDLDVASADTIYFTDSSSRWGRRDYMIALLEAVPDGKVLKLDVTTKRLEVVLDGLHFANGIQFFPDKESFLVAETLTARIIRHWVSGPKSGETEVFADNLPGYPDNIRLGADSTFWIALGAVRHSNVFSMLDFLADKPGVRKVILRALQAMPRKWRDQFLERFRTKHTMIVQMDANGKIISSAHDYKGSVVSEVSQVTDSGDFLYLGSIHGRHIARLHKSFISGGRATTAEAPPAGGVSDEHEALESQEGRREDSSSEPSSEQQSQESEILQRQQLDEEPKAEEVPADEPILQERYNEPEPEQLPHEEALQPEHVNTSANGEELRTEAPAS